MSALTRLALEVLQSPSAQPGLKATSCATLLAAMEQAIEVPPESQFVVWRYLLSSDASAATMHRQQLNSREVARDALRVLSDADAGETAQELAMAVLRGDNVVEVRDEDLVSLADHILDEGRVRRVTWLVEQVHEQRGLEPAFLVMLRDRMAGSGDAAVRVGSVAVGALLPRLDEDFTRRMLVDASPIVRTAAADTLEAVGQHDREKGLALIRDQLGIETHRSALAALYFALATLVRAGGRRAREWVPSEDAH